MHWEAVVGFATLWSGKPNGPFLHHHVAGGVWSLFLRRVKAEGKLTHITHLASYSTIFCILWGASLSPDAPALSEKSGHANVDKQFTGTYRHISTPKFWRPNKQIESSEAFLGSKA